MKSNDILNLVANKALEVEAMIQKDYDRGLITLKEKNKSNFYVDQFKYEVQRVMKSLTNPEE